MTKTQLLYLPRFGVVDGVAQVMACWQDGDSWCLILDQTVFYPGGGGQPADSGELAFEHAVLPVHELWMTDEGVVIHRVGSIPEGLRTGSRVQMHVDVGVRSRHCRLHSAGHVIDMAVSRLGYAWEPTKGAHFPHMSFVEYETGEALEEGAREALQLRCNQLISKGSANTISFVDQSGEPLMAPDLGHLEAERIVAYDDFGVSCGGTHVADIAEIGEIVIKKVKKKKSTVKVSYTVTSP